MNEGNAKQQIVEKIKNSNNILVTVSTDPSVDELSAALGLTILLNKMNKHTTAVFSGAIPEAMAFLAPEKTFEGTVDSLRDFIIALDKEKADHLRYKVDGDVVKIFITPYKTTITSDDLEFSQGDYNVELVLALGVDKRENLDKALSAHGRILHDATVATVSVGDVKSELGSINVHEQHASSLSEILMSMTEAFKSDKAGLDEQIATAFLTGIVAATDRFSNNKTSSKVMTMAAQLMAAGANQQLIASKLAEASAITTENNVNDNDSSNDNADGTTNLTEGESTKVRRKRRRNKKPAAPVDPKPKDDGALHISHVPEGTIEEVAAQTQEAQQADALKVAADQLEKQATDVASRNQQEAADAAEKHLEEELQAVLPPVTPVAPAISVADLQQDIAASDSQIEEAAAAVEEPVVSPQPEPQPVVQETESKPDSLPKPVELPQPTLPTPEPVVPTPAPVPAPTPVAPVPATPVVDTWQKTEEPSLGGTLNATTEQAADEKRRALDADRNRTILTHKSGSYVGDAEQTFNAPINGTAVAEEEPRVPDPFAPQTMGSDTTPPTAYAQPIAPPEPMQTLADLDQQHRPAAPDEARAAVDAALNAAAPLVTPEPVMPVAPEAAMPLPPPLPDFSTLPPPLPPLDGDQLPPERLGDVFAPLPDQPAPVAEPPAPGQFRIPGQS